MAIQLRSARGRLLWFILLLMIFPAINQRFNIIKSAPLKLVGGNAKPAFSWKGWWKGSYQDSMAKFCNDSVGFRADMIRTVNQVNFSCFKNMNLSGIIVGRNNNLFWLDYITSYCGTDYGGDDMPLEPMRKLKKIQDTMERMGKMFVLVHSGSKASYFAADIPDELHCHSDGKTNLKNYIRIADSFGIHQINFNSWVASLNGKKEHHLFNKQGIHWNPYGAYFVADSLISYMENVRKIHMPHPHIVSIEHTYKARYNEDDLESLLNLIFPVDTTAYWYPEIRYDDTVGLTRPKVIYIGDSYISALMYDGIYNAHTDPEYWFYFDRAIFFKDWQNESLRKQIDDYDWPGALEKADCVVVMYTITGLVNNASKFIDKAYNYYYPGKN